jgi:hypothetical protein
MKELVKVIFMLLVVISIVAITRMILKYNIELDIFLMFCLFLGPIVSFLLAIYMFNIKSIETKSVREFTE